MQTTSDHCGGRCAAAGAHHCASMTRARGRNEQSEPQNGIKRGLDTQGDEDRQEVPTVAQELACGVIPALRPGENTKVDACHECGAKQESSEWDEETFHNEISWMR